MLFFIWKKNVKDKSGMWRICYRPLSLKWLATGWLW